MNCKNCNNEIPNGSNFCQYCGAKNVIHQSNNICNNPQYVIAMPKSRIGYILLGLFFGGWGIHNFYAGYSQKAVIQLILGVFSCCIISGIWAIIDICTIDCDANGVPFCD